MARATKALRVKYDRVVPEGSILGDYLKLMQPLETSTAYDFWCGLFVLSTAIGRKIVVDRGGAPVFLNIFCILVAQSGVTRKSTAVRHAMKFVHKLSTSRHAVIEGKITPEMLEAKMHQQGKLFGASSAIIGVSELATFLGREKYVAHMPALLTDLYDCAAMRAGGGSITVGGRDLIDVFTNFLSASTPTWLIRAVNPDVIEGGFTSRVIFVHSELPKHRAPWPEPQDNELSESIYSRLVDTRTKAESVSKIQISEGGRKLFEKWYRTRQLHRDPFRSSYQSREDAHVLRLAALLSINDDTWVIHHSHILSAIKIITEVREDGANLFEGTGTAVGIVAGIDKLRDKIIAAGTSGIQQRELTKACAAYFNAETMRAVLDIMHELQMLQKFDLSATGPGRPATLWRGTRLLTGPNAIDRIVQELAPQTA